MRNDKDTFLFLLFDQFYHFIDNMQIKLVIQACFFQSRNEFRRRQETFFRIDPSGQCFDITDPFIDSTNDRLDIDLDPVFFYGLIDIFDNILLMEDLIVEFLSIISVTRDIDICDGIAGKLSPV